MDRVAFKVPRRTGCRRVLPMPANSGWVLWLGVLAVALIGAASPVQAQETGTLRGSVILVETGDPVDGALIQIIGTGAFTFTDDGIFQFTNVPVGSYEVTAQREHLAAGRQTVTVAAGETAGLDFALSLLLVREEVNVTAEVTVGAEATLRAFNAVSTLDSFEIARDAPGSIGEALDDEPGIANRSFGPGSSRPIVRGFGGDRVHIIEDGIPTGDLSSTSDHHGVTIDPSSAERIEITRGPATLLYGSNIIGLINVITPHAAYRNLLTPPESYGDTLLDGTRGRLGTDATSASRQVGTYANVQHSRGHLLYWGSGAYRQAGDYASPEGSVFNSATELSNARAGLGYFGDRFFTSLSLTKEDSRFGLPYEDRFHAHGNGDEHDHEDDGEEHEEDRIEIDLASERHVARLDIGMRNIDNSVIQGIRTGFFAIAVQDDHVDTIGGVENVDSRFSNRTYITRTLVYQRQQDHITGRFGSELRFRNFAATGAEALAPRTEQVSLSAFGYEELTFGRYRLQVGGRLERTDYDAAGRPALAGGDHGHDEDDEHDHEDDEHDHEDDGEEHDEVGEEHVPMPPDPRDRHFLAASGSVGLHADLGSGSAIVANLTHSHRVPALEELYNFGPHLGNFEIGKTDLAAETMRSFEVSFRQRLGRVQGETNFYSETGTRGYSVVNMEASYVWPRQHFAHVLSFTGYNLTNALYRNHTSFIKDLAPEMGRGVRVGYSLRFF